MPENIIAMLGLGFGFGLLHALDADHIMAVSCLASRASGRQQAALMSTLRFCAQWALGHGGVLCLLGVLVLFMGARIPASLSALAEKMIGVMLISLGVWILWQIYRHKIHLQVHSHPGLTHVHLAEGKHARHDHSSVLVGMTHGLAGSAPVLAIVPALTNSSAWLGLVYIMLFSTGVLSTMLLFGLGYGRLQQWLARRSKRLFDASRLVMATVSMGFGTYWLFAP